MEAMTDETTVYDENYPSRRLLDLIGDKWTPIILYVLGLGTRRYGVMQRHLPDISKKMLTQTLRALEEGGLLRRKVYPEVPPKVEYDLTALGRIYLEPVTALCRWAAEHSNDLDAVQMHRRKARRRK
jgi:DNA-binding HxlR family transcriptional regulator